MDNVGQALPQFLGGLVLFFLGLDWVKSSLKSLASRSMRRRMQAMVGSPVRASLFGMGFGGVSQSALAVAMVLAGAVTTGLLPLGRALTAVAWANVGTAVLGFLAAVNLHMATLWILGGAGLALRQRRLVRFKPLLGTLFGVAFMLYGLVHLKRAADPLQASAGFATFTAALNGSPLLAFAAGGLLRLVIQSSSGISVILITLCGRGLLQPELVLMAMAGTGLGIAGSVLLFGRGLQGEGLRIAYWQALASVFSGLIMGAWCLVAGWTGLPNALACLSSLHLPLETALASVFLMQMLLYPVVGAVGGDRMTTWLARLAPERAEIGLARPLYLSETALDQPELALEQARREQLRMLRAMPALLDRARLEAGKADSRDPGIVAESLESLGSEITAFLTEALERDEDAADTREHLAVLQRQQWMRELAGQLTLLATQAESLPPGSPARELAANLVDSADLILHQLLDWLERGEAVDREMLEAMTQDRGAQMESLRQRAAGGLFGSARDQATVLYAATLFERVVYLARRLAGC